MGKITVVVAEDHAVVREGLCLLLNGEKDIEVVGEAENGRQAVELARGLSPAVVVMDIAMPMLNGVEATRQIKQLLPTTQVIVLSAYCREDQVEQVVAAGASGYLMKITSAKNLARAVREVGKGKKFFESSMARRVHAEYRQTLFHGKPIRSRGSLLTPRESQVLQLVAEGMASKVIADELGISVKTVEKHRHNLKRKLEIQDIAGLTRYAISEGVIGDGGEYRDREN